MIDSVDRPLLWSLLVLRLSTGAFFLIWALEKIFAPEIARRVFETFYFSSPPDTLLLLLGLAQLLFVLAFMAGLFRFWTYGALLAMHAVSVVSSFPRLLDPFTPPNHLFWAGVPVLGLLVALFLLRNRDNLFTLSGVKVGGQAIQRGLAIAAIGGAATLAVALPGTADAGQSITVYSCTAQQKLVDTTNTHWIETPSGVTVVET